MWGTMRRPRFRLSRRAIPSSPTSPTSSIACARARNLRWMSTRASTPRSMVDHGMFEGRTDHITLLPERRVIDDAYKAKFGDDAETKIPIEQKGDPIVPHITNFLDCMRTREKPTLDVDTGFHAQVTISMAVQSYREGRVLYWDDKNQKAVNKPVKA